MKKIKLQDSYMAGYFDGDGCLGVYHRLDGSGKRYWRLTVIVRSACKAIVYAIQSTYGGWAGPVRKLGPLSIKPQWQWQLSGTKQGLPFLRRLQPFLVEKRVQCGVAIAFAEGRVAGLIANRKLTKLRGGWSQKHGGRRRADAKVRR